MSQMGEMEEQTVVGIGLDDAFGPSGCHFVRGKQLSTTLGPWITLTLDTTSKLRTNVTDATSGIPRLNLT